MSHVDSSIHIHCGNIILDNSHLPIYWVLDEKLENECSQEIIKYNDLIIGGGSGEHPALHIRDADLLVLQFLINKLKQNDIVININVEDIFSKIYLERGKKSKVEYIEKYGVNEFVIFIDNYINISEWPIATLYKIEKEYLENFDYQDNYQCSEDLFIFSIANFIIKNLPKQFFHKDILEIINLYKYKEEIKINCSLNIEKVFTNNCAGKNIIDNKVKWGYSLEEYIEEQKIIEEKQLLDKNIVSKSISKLNKI